MLTIGCHLSKRRGYLEMAKEAASINANTFQYFTRSPRGSEQAALDEKDVAAYLAFAKEHGIHDALAYAPYDADPATDKMNERDFALMVYSEDLARLAEVDGSLYLIRPGSRLDISVEEGLADVADALNKIITPSMKTCVLLDTMAGEGTQVGTSFEQLAAEKAGDLKDAAADAAEKAKDAADTAKEKAADAADAAKDKADDAKKAAEDK